MFKTILVPIEIGHADKVNSIINVAAKNGYEDARIILLNVIEEIPRWAAVGLPANLQKKSLQNSQQELANISSACSVKTEVEVRAGHPYQTILEVSEENSVELIVIASHKPGFQDYLLGSTAAKVVRHANCSVLVIR
jgi:universal stress protein F